MNASEILQPRSDARRGTGWVSALAPATSRDGSADFSPPLVAPVAASEGGINSALQPWRCRHASAGFRSGSAGDVQQMAPGRRPALRPGCVRAALSLALLLTWSAPDCLRAQDAPPSVANPEGRTNAAPDEIQVSFQAANIDMIVQWLAQATGKSVVKHPRVQCQLTIVSSKRVTTREAIDLIYRGLALEGFTAVESSNAIVIVPEGQEPKMSPELLDAAQGEIPQGRQRLVKMFPLTHVQATDLRERIRGALSDKGTVETDDRVNQLIVTDYNENLRLVAQLIKDLDLSASYLT